ncbi:DUF2252 domain-containing protein [Chitinophagaceae bacterium LB-8]|uniref:DUF2252 domain-containing protein n=1 Tax=Paraflavisolibacter caeni TaxID=2982496 RepID=A0A9X3BJV7_9BACT|nr:DUF2252 family protein [Paraflavisolibacter caeni]MCU7551693.1 DUF2252 domain-containing protein [Paraflavisolibacter caeni]
MSTSQTVSERIKAFNSQLLPNIVQRKYQLMAEDPFRFYRGTNHLFYEDLKASNPLPSSPSVWLCGDLHLENFGSYKGDNRQVYFDLSDFDEGILGPSLWEITRMVTSIFVGFDTLQISPNLTEKCAAKFLKKYADVLASAKARYIELATSTGLIKELLEKVSARKDEKWLRKRIKEDGSGNFKFKELEYKQFPVDNQELKEALIHHMSNLTLYKNEKLTNFSVLDVCFRIAGTGSLGVKRYLFLLQTKEDYWLLDMKETKPSSLKSYIEVQQPSWSSEGERVISIEYRMQDVPEALLTTTVFKGNSYKIQEMQPTEDKIDFHQVKDDFDHLFKLIENMAMLTASAQLRSTGRQGSAIADELIAFGKIDTWQEPVLSYSRAYARQVKNDYQRYLEDYKNGFFHNPNT